MPTGTDPGTVAWPRSAGTGADAPKTPAAGREERRFGFAVGAVLLLAGGGFLLAGSKAAGAGLALAGALLVLLAAARPPALAPVRRAWDALARALGQANTALLLGLVYFLVLAPLGIALRLAGRDELARRRSGAGGWVPCSDRGRDPRHFEKMF